MTHIHTSRFSQAPLMRAIGLVIACAIAFASAPAWAVSQADSPAGCQLDPVRHRIQHVIFIEFDNVHFRRDNPNVPSDLEQMPHLLNFEGRHAAGQ